MIYIVYQIWLFRNYLNFDGEVVSMHRVLERAWYLIAEYLCFDATTNPLDTPDHWNSHAAPATPRWALFISWEPPPSGCVKVKFNGSIRRRKGGAGFIIRSSNAWLLTAGGSISMSPRSQEGASHWLDGHHFYYAGASCGENLHRGRLCYRHCLDLGWRGAVGGSFVDP